jgi:hypothetical protein
MPWFGARHLTDDHDHSNGLGYHVMRQVQGIGKQVLDTSNKQVSIARLPKVTRL